MVEVEKRSIRSGDACWLKKLEFEINNLLDKEAKTWSQRSRVTWLKDGDKNMRFLVRHPKEGVETILKAFLITGPMENSTTSGGRHCC